VAKDKYPVKMVLVSDSNIITPEKVVEGKIAPPTTGMNET